MQKQICNFFSYAENYMMSHFKALKFQEMQKNYQKGKQLPGQGPTGFQKSNAFLM